MMSAKMATPDLLKIKIFWNKGYDAVISGHGVNMYSCDQNLVTLAFLWEKLS